MAYDQTNAPLKRGDITGYYGDATARPDSTKYQWYYITNDPAATVEVANYFDACTELGKGDIISAVMAVGSTPVCKNYVVLTGLRSGDAHNTIGLQTGTAG
ncbi:MAG: hypothetical protein ACR650_09800 [Methylocystis sp.]